MINCKYQRLVTYLWLHQMWVETADSLEVHVCVCVCHMVGCWPCSGDTGAFLSLGFQFKSYIHILSFYQFSLMMVA